MQIVRFLDRLLDWYWTSAVNRETRYRLWEADWTRRVYEARRIAESLFRASDAERSTLAVWGPSQAGKSTLISAYVDGKSVSASTYSALQWAEDPPVTFSTSLDGAVVLNPHNHGSDASGCVTRFYFAESVFDRDHPVGLHFIEPDEIAHAIALGYLSECRRDEEVVLSIDTIRDTISKCLPERPDEGIESRRRTFELLESLVSLLETLANGEHARYRSLHGHTALLRKLLLENERLVSCATAARHVVATCLWDAKPKLTEFYRNLVDYRDRLEQMLGNVPCYCSMEAARVLLDIDTYSKVERDPEVARDARQQLNVDTSPDCVKLGKSGGFELVRSNYDLGLLQALVRELRVPLSAEFLSKGSKDFYGFIKDIDLLDFPGVALADKGSRETQINLDDGSEVSPSDLFSSVLKRGKTASIINRYATSFQIDGFAVFNRISMHPAKPEQLIQGVRSWWQAYAPHAEPEIGKKCPLPLVLVLTFCAHLVNSVAQVGVKSGLNPIFERLSKLYFLSDPKCIAATMATNYPAFSEGRIHEVVEAKVAHTQKLIMADSAFQRQFSNQISRDSFQQMVDNGGTDYLFKGLHDLFGARPAQDLKQQRAAALLDEIELLVADALPKINLNSTEQRRVLATVATHLKKSIAKGTWVESDTVLRHFIAVDPINLSPIPRAARLLSTDELEEYARQQLENWATAATAARSDYQHLGLDEGGDLSTLVFALVDAANVSDIGVWLHRHLGDVKTGTESKRSRRYLAIRLTNELLGLTTARREHVQTDQIAQRFIELSASGSEWAGNLNPNWHNTTSVFIAHLEDALSAQVSEMWPPQPGDDQILALQSEWQQISHGT